MLYVVAGDLGSGKTLQMMQWIQAEVLKDRPVYSNIELLPACPFYDKVARLDHPDGSCPILEGDRPKRGVVSVGYRAWWNYVLPGSFVVIDEADLWFDAAEHGELGHDVRGFHKMLRKVDLDVVYIVQSVSNLYVRLRRLAQRFIICEWNYRVMRAFRWLPIRMSSFFRSEFVDEALVDERDTVRIPYGEAVQYFGWFRTKQLMGNLKMYGNPNFDPVTCSDCGYEFWRCEGGCRQCGRPLSKSICVVSS